MASIDKNDFCIQVYDGEFKDKLKELLTQSKNMSILQRPCKMAIPERYAKFHQRYQDCVVQPTDIWVCSFPKAGSTWTQEMVWTTLYGLNHPGITDLLDKRFPFFDIDCIIPDNYEDIPYYRDLAEDDPNRPNMAWKIMHNMDPPRTIKSHLPKPLLPSQISKGKVVYVMRDPRDVCVSYYYFLKSYDEYIGGLDDFVQLFLADVLLWCPFWDHVLDFWKLRDSPNVLILRYEDMKANLPGNIKRLAEFLGKDISEEELNNLAKHLTFNSMSKNPAVNHDNIGAGEDQTKTKFMRKGKVGDWRAHFSESQIQAFKSWTEKNLEGSDFPYYQDY